MCHGITNPLNLIAPSTSRIIPELGCARTYDTRSKLLGRQTEGKGFWPTWLPDPAPSSAVIRPVRCSFGGALRFRPTQSFPLSTYHGVATRLTVHLLYIQDVDLNNINLGKREKGKR